MLITGKWTHWPCLHVHMYKHTLQAWCNLGFMVLYNSFDVATDLCVGEGVWMLVCMGIQNDKK